MGSYDTRLTPELADLAYDVEEKAKGAGLDIFETVFELIDYKQLAEIAAYGGFPTRYPHWRFGMEFDRIDKSYTYGLSIIYEMVINNDPCYAYLLRANNMVFQKTVMAHVFGHCDFFKNNYWFQGTNRKMLDQMANHAATVKGLIEDIGHDEVESFIDTILSLENLIDMYNPPRVETSGASGSTEDELEHRRRAVPRIDAKKYMDSYVNPKEFIEEQKKRQNEELDKLKKFPSSPVRDVLKFLIDYAPISEWERQIIRIIRDEAYYFAPQGQTKIINEGWATFWHSRMMTKIAPLSDSEIVDYCDHYAGVVAQQPGQLNPYKLGVELLKHIESRWDRGQHGIEYLHCDDPKVRAAWDRQDGRGHEKLFEVRKFHNDISFIDEFLDEDFCHNTKMFIYDYDPRNNRYTISSRNFAEIKSKLLSQLTNFGQPIIHVVDGNYANRGELLLEHEHEGMDLKQETMMETLKSLHRVWQRPVHVVTRHEDAKKRISFDGKAHQIDKI